TPHGSRRRDCGRRQRHGQRENGRDGSSGNSCSEESRGHGRCHAGSASITNRGTMQRTFTILKPDTVKAGNSGLIIDRLIKEGFQIRAAKMMHLSKAQAEGFYYVHKERPFFGDLVRFMTEGPIILMILEAEGAIEKLRKLMGATDPGK